MALSVAIHGVALLFLFWRVAPIFVRPKLLARGSDGSATPISTALYFPLEASVAAISRPSLLSFPQAPRKRIEKSRLRERQNNLRRDQQRDPAEAGSHFGSELDGSEEGDEIRPGFAVVFTDPRVPQWQIPGGRPGDVIVELTIDEQGNVVKERLLQGLGPSIDDKVIATLRDWHFRPATRNGVAIPFKYDAHFHFPS